MEGSLWREDWIGLDSLFRQERGIRDRILKQEVGEKGGTRGMEGVAGEGEM